MKKIIQEFKEFALKGNMLDLAVGVLIGSSFSALVTSLTNNIIQPLLNCFGAEDATSGVGQLAIKFGKLNMPVGQFLADVINFVIMAFVIFMIVKGVNKLSTLGKKKTVEEEPAPTHCTSDLPEIEVEKSEEKVEDKPKAVPRKKTAK